MQRLIFINAMLIESWLASIVVRTSLQILRRFFWPPSCRKVEPQNGEREVVSTCVRSFSISLLHDNKEVFQGVKEVDRRRVSNVSPSKATIMPVDVSTTFPKRGVNSYHSTRIENRKEWFIGLIRQSWLSQVSPEFDWLARSCCKGL